MKIEVVRRPGDGCTLGDLYVDGEHICYTLEDVMRDGPKIPGQTAIPNGTYDVIVTHSHKFNQSLPLLMHVPGFEGVRIHPGNNAADTEGCLLVGLQQDERDVMQSRAAFAILFPMIETSLARGEGVTIEYRSA